MNEIASGIVFQSGGQALTTSLIVAREFGKRHDHVLRDIDALLGGLPKSGDTRLFEKTTYTNEQNGQSYPMYLMNRDGFVLLAMGFTGEKALEFKMKFLTAFSLMEKALNSDEYIMARALQISKKKIEQQEQQIQMLEGRNRLLEQEAQEMAPKAAYTDAVLQSRGTYTHTQMAKELSFRSVNAFLAACKKDGILYKQSDMWMLYAKHSGNGYMKTRTHHYTKSSGETGTNTITVWTEAGRLFLHKHFNVELQPVDFTMFDFGENEG